MPEGSCEVSMNKALTAITAAVFSAGAIALFFQHREIEVLRALVAKTEAAPSQPPPNSEKTNATRKEMLELRAEVVALKASLVEPTRPRSAAASEKSSRDLAGAALPTPTDTEENRRKRTQYVKRYDAFLSQRGLTRKQIERVYDLFILQDAARLDLQASVRELGMDGNAPEVEPLRYKLYAPMTRELQDILGDDGYAAYNRFQSTSFFRVAYVERMQPRFASADLPLTPAQSDLLVELLAENNHPVKMSPNDIGSQSRIDWDALAQKTPSFLNSQQQLALHAFISEEKARQR